MDNFREGKALGKPGSVVEGQFLHPLFAILLLECMKELSPAGLMNPSLETARKRAEFCPEQ